MTEEEEIDVEKWAKDKLQAYHSYDTPKPSANFTLRQIKEIARLRKALSVALDHLEECDSPSKFIPSMAVQSRRNHANKTYQKIAQIVELDEIEELDA